MKRDVVGDRHAVAIEPAIEAAEIDIEIFDLGRPVGRERGFESAPIVQPALSLLVIAEPGTEALILSNAAPPVT